MYARLRRASRAEALFPVLFPDDLSWASERLAFATAFASYGASRAIAHEHGVSEHRINNVTVYIYETFQFVILGVGAV